MRPTPQSKTHVVVVIPVVRPPRVWVGDKKLRRAAEVEARGVAQVRSAAAGSVLVVLSASLGVGVRISVVVGEPSFDPREAWEIEI